MPILVIAAYRCEVAGNPVDSVDFQVRYFQSDSEDEVVERLQKESGVCYKNVQGEDVRWFFDKIAALEYNPEWGDGDELIGFITGNQDPRITCQSAEE